MKIAFIIGPYRADTVFEIVENIRRAEAVEIELIKAGFGVICPHKNTALLNGIVDEEVFLAMYIEILRRCCDFAVTLDGFSKSAGSRNEVRAAMLHRIPIYPSVEGAINAQS